MTQRVAVLAYASNNVGDDLFVDTLLTRYPHTAFEFISADPNDFLTLERHRNATMVSANEFRNSIPGYSAFVIIGGSMFQQKDRWLLQWAGYVRKALLCRLRGVPVVVVGASFGPSHTRNFTRAYRLFFRLCNWASFRDQESLHAIRQTRTASWFPDLAFAMDSAPLSHQSQSDLVGVSVMTHNQSPEACSEYRVGMAKMIETLSNESRVRLFSFQESTQVSDGAEIDTILTLLSESTRTQVEVVRYHPKEMDAFLEAFAECGRVVACRFHSLVLALLFQKPVCALAYHEKVVHTLRSLDIHVPAYGPHQYADAWDKVPSELPTLTAEPPALIGRLALQAVNHFNMLDAILAEPATD